MVNEAASYFVELEWNSRLVPLGNIEYRWYDARSRERGRARPCREDELLKTLARWKICLILLLFALFKQSPEVGGNCDLTQAPNTMCACTARRQDERGGNKERWRDAAQKRLVSSCVWFNVGGDSSPRWAATAVRTDAALSMWLCRLAHLWLQSSSMKQKLKTRTSCPSDLIPFNLFRPHQLLLHLIWAKFSEKNNALLTSDS